MLHLSILPRLYLLYHETSNPTFDIHNGRNGKCFLLPFQNSFMVSCIDVSLHCFVFTAVYNDLRWKLFPSSVFYLIFQSKYLNIHKSRYSYTAFMQCKLQKTNKSYLSIVVMASLLGLIFLLEKQRENTINHVFLKKKILIKLNWVYD